MNYKCDQCNYTTTKKSNYNRHINSIKHHQIIDDNIKIKNINYENKIYVCIYCKTDFVHSGHLNRHYNSCILRKDSIGKEYHSQKDNEIKLLKEMITFTNNLALTSTNTINYLIKNHDNTPSLPMSQDYSLMYDDKKHFIQDIIFYHKTKDLFRYLGNFIIGNYEKDDPKIQTILTNKKEYSINKNGVKTTEYIIAPMLKYIKDIMLEYVDERRIKIAEEKPDNVIAINQELLMIENLISCINDNSITFDIIRYIAPYFYLGVKTNIEMIES
jgi:hypothetical protein